MSKSFRSWGVDQTWLLVPSIHEFLPASRPVPFVRDTMREWPEVSVIVGRCGEETAYPPNQLR